MRPNASRLTALICSLAFLDLALWLAAIPLLPRWERELGLSKGESGVVVGAYAVSVLFVSLPLGRLADRVGPKRMTVLATLLFALAAPALAFAGSFWELVAVRLAQGLFSAISWTAGLAWIISAAPPGQRARPLALVNASATAATFAGPVLGGPVVVGLGLTPTMAGFGGLVALCALWAMLEPGGHESDRARPSVLRELGLGARSAKVRAAFTAILFAAIALGTIQLLAPLHLGDEGLSDSEVGWVFALAAGGALATTVALSRVADRIDRIWTMVCSVGLIGAGNVLFATSLPLSGYLADTVVLTLAFSPLFVLSYALCADGAEEAGTGSGTAMGALNTVWATGALTAPVVAGKLAGAGGDAIAFALVAGVSALAAVGLLQARRADAATARNVEQAHRPTCGL